MYICCGSSGPCVTLAVYCWLVLHFDRKGPSLWLAGPALAPKGEGGRRRQRLLLRFDFCAAAGSSKIGWSPEKKTTKTAFYANFLTNISSSLSDDVPRRSSSREEEEDKSEAATTAHKASRLPALEIKRISPHYYVLTTQSIPN